MIFMLDILTHFQLQLQMKKLRNWKLASDDNHIHFNSKRMKKTKIGRRIAFGLLRKL